MGAIRTAKQVNLICGLISSDVDLMARAVRMMTEYFGPTDAQSDTWPFEDTDYYLAEMGDDLLRRFVSFERLIRPDEIAYIKGITNEIERRLCRDLGVSDDQRRVNLDPGYMALAKLVLATTKDFSHRIYLRDGIYAESTLHYENGQWLAWPWTYPDYAADRYHAFFNELRDRYRMKLNARMNVTATQQRGDA